MNHLIPQKIREYRYYEQKLPLYLRNDKKFMEHFKLWYSLLMGNGDDTSTVSVRNIAFYGNTIGGNGTPEAPIAIQSVESPVTIVNCGKNIFKPYSTGSYTNKGITISIDDDYVISFSGSATAEYWPEILYKFDGTGSTPQENVALPFESGVRYTMSINSSNAFPTNYAFAVMYFVDGVQMKHSFYSHKPFTFTLGTSGISRVYLYCNSSFSVSDYKFTIQIEKGTTATDDETYQGTTLSMPIKDTAGNDLTLRKLSSTVYDSVYKENGKWYCKKAINGFLAGSQNWQVIGDRIQLTIDDNIAHDTSSTMPNILSSHFISKTYTQVVNENQYGIFMYYNIIGIRDTSFIGKTLTQIKELLSSNNVVIIYALAEPNIMRIHADSSELLEDITFLQNTFVKGANGVFATFISEKDAPIVTENITITDFQGISPTCDLLLLLLNIHDNDFLRTLSDTYGYKDNADILDKIGNLFGLRRAFSFEYYETASSVDKTLTSVSLNDKEFLLLIKAQIIRNYCDGTYEQVIQYYNDTNLQILPIYNESYNASVDAYLNGNDRITSNINKLFKGGFLTIEHLGIRYTYTITEILRVLLWSDELSPTTNNAWADETSGGVFAI